MSYLLQRNKFHKFGVHAYNTKNLVRKMAQRYFGGSGRGNYGGNYGDSNTSGGSTSQWGRGSDFADERRGNYRRGPPPGLRGRDIGMFYARRSQQKKKEMEKKNRPVVSLNKWKLEKISNLLRATKDANYGNDTNNRFKKQYLKNLHGNADTHFGREITECRKNALERNVVLDDELQANMSTKHQSSKYINLLAFRKKLPAYDLKEDIVKLIEKNQVVVISGETGSGKTTQVAQFILDDYIARGNGSVCRIVCTQPRRISAISVAERVANERDETCGRSSVGYQIRLDSKLPRDQGSILYCTTGIVLQWMNSDPYLTQFSHIILDEIHERDVLSEFLITVLKDLLPKRPDMKVILMSATLNAEEFANYFNNCPSFAIPGAVFPVKEYYLEDVLEMTGFQLEQESYGRPKYGRQHSQKVKAEREYEDMIAPYVRQLRYERKYSEHTLSSLLNPQSEEINPDLIVKLLEHISRQEDSGAVLVFLPGWDTISTLHEMLSSHRTFSNSRRYRVIPLHSMMPTMNQREVFERPPHGVRKIVLATNIAETSITIDDVVYVVDCGKIKIKNFDEKHNLTTLQPEWVSLANARQRRGRAGRVQPGICYHLYSKAREQTFNQFPVPEILRTRLEEVVLQVKFLQLGQVRPFLSRVMQPPSDKAIELSLKMLSDLNAIDDAENLTPLGFHIAQLPLDPQTAKMILMGAILNCVDPVLSVAAGLSFKSPFIIPIGKERQADKMRKVLSNDSKSDHIVLVRAMEMWEKAKLARREHDFCWDYFLSSNTLQLLKNMKRQFAEHLHSMKFLSSDNPKDELANQNSDNINLVKAIICAGLYPNVAKIEMKGRRNPRATFYTEDGKVCLHPKSVNESENNFDSPYLVYHSKIQSSRIFLHDATIVHPFPLLFFGKGIDIYNDDGVETVAVDSIVKFRCDQRTSRIVKELRSQLDSLLLFKINNPGITNWDQQTKEGALLSAVVELITSEDHTLIDTCWDDEHVDEGQ